MNDDGSIDYIDDAQIFEYDHGGHQGGDASVGALSQERLQHQPQQPHQQHQQHIQHQEGGQDYDDDVVNRNARGYYDYGHVDNGQHGEGDMW